MANGSFLRGEIYDIRMDSGVGSEQGSFRPGAIVSCNQRNKHDNTVTVALMTTRFSRANYYCNVETSCTGRVSWIMCNQLITVDKMRLGDFKGVLSDDEIEKLDERLEDQLNLGGSSEIDSLRSDIVKKDGEIASLKMEIEMWQKCYTRCMDMLVDTKVSSDLSRRTAPEKPTKIVDPDEPVIVPKNSEPEPESEKVDLNSCTVEDLKKCGCTEVIAKTIIAGRPYVFVDDLRRIPGITNVGFGILKNKVCANPVAAEEPEVAEEPVVEEPLVVEEPAEVEVEVANNEKININSATGRELMEKLGINECYAYTITSYRNKNGRFVALEELLEVPRLPKTFYERHKDRLTIAEDEPSVDDEVIEDEADPQEPEIEEPEKVNVNTASAQEIKSVTGWSLATCYGVTGNRKRNGPYKSLDELTNIDKLSESMLSKCRDKLTVGELQQESNKLNINLASLRELMDVGFGKRAAALIVNERKKYGNFRSVDDLSEIPEISGKILRKLRDKLEV